MYTLGGIIEMGPNQGLGRMIREFGHERSGNAQPGDYYEDQKKEDFIDGRKEHYPLCFSTCGSRERCKETALRQSLSSTSRQAKQTELTAPLFSDCTGDATIGYLAGADWAMGREGRDEYGESLAPRATRLIGDGGFYTMV